MLAHYWVQHSTTFTKLGTPQHQFSQNIPTPYDLCSQNTIGILRGYQLLYIFLLGSTADNIKDRL